MKPVIIEQNITRLKALIAEVTPDKQELEDISPLISDLESQLKQMDDAKESNAILVLLSVILLPLVGYLLYIGYYWPSLIAVAWLGALLYYRVNERSLSIETLKAKAKISPHHFGPKINYLLSGIHQKIERLKLIRIFNFVFWPFAVFMGQLILNQGVSIAILLALLAVIFILNALFWNNYYKPSLAALDSLQQHLNELNYKLLLATNEGTEVTKLYEEEE